MILCRFHSVLLFAVASGCSTGCCVAGVIVVAICRCYLSLLFVVAVAVAGFEYCKLVAAVAADVTVVAVVQPLLSICC